MKSLMAAVERFDKTKVWQVRVELSFGVCERYARHAPGCRILGRQRVKQRSQSRAILTHTVSPTGTPWA